MWKMIIGLTGSYCSGKDTVAEYIVEKYNFIHYSLSDVIRNVMNKEKIETTRENLIVFGTKLRSENGNGVLARLVIKQMNDKNNYCITSIRHPDEVCELKKQKEFTLIYVDAPQEIRFERMLNRKRSGDPQTIEKFIELQNKESQTSGSGQQLVKTAQLADLVFINDFSDIKLLEKNIDDLLNKLKNA
jgi:dephospho-CoA kinase